MKHSRPEDLFRAEKERATSARNSQHARLLAEAKAAFDKLMAEGQAARKSGRPRKHPLPPLKTSSSRIPPRPPVAAAPSATPVVAAAKPAAAAAPAAVTVTKSAPAKLVAKPRPEAKGTIKRTAAPKRGAKSVGKAPTRGSSKATGKSKGRSRR